ncbi:MAG: DUF4097 domain-containing protein [Lachnospiraceae bacterium]|nr:DUF4097 domain-containing protein [Lachnospiraceae bacterium]
MNTSEWRKRYVRRLNAVTIIIIIVFGISHLMGFFFNGLKGLTAGIIPSVFGKKAVTSQLESTEAFTSIEGKLPIGDLEIVAGDGYSVEFKNYPSGKEPSVEISGDKLRIQGKSYSWGLFSNDFPSNCSMIITIPHGAIGNIELEMDMGSISMEGINAADVNLEANMGGITLKNCHTEKLDLNADMGSIIVDSVQFTKGSFDADMGAIKITDGRFERAECDAGMGSIDIDGEFDELTADCGMGSIDVKNSNANAKYVLDTDMGSVKVNGTDQGNKYRNH